MNNISTKIVKAGDYVLSAPKVLAVTNSEKYQNIMYNMSDIITITGNGFIMFINSYKYTLAILDLVIDGVSIGENVTNATQKVTNLSIEDVRFNPIYFNKNISLKVKGGYTSNTPNTAYCVYQVGLK